MSVLNRRIGRVGFALGYLPVLGIVLVLTWNMPNHKWPIDWSPSRIVVATSLLLWSGLITAWRCHDFGKSAWSDFWTEQAPVIGPLLSLWDLFFTPGEPLNNAYGPVPKL
jgi:uncharacterized membrane protein YhaH (DUF805 family)